MAQAYKVLAQVAPAANTLSDLYIVPAATDVVISSLIIANRSTSVSGTYKIAITPNGETIANKHYIAFDVTLDPSESAILTMGLTLDSTDKVLVMGSTANLSFSIFGTEISN
jgi:hypothetical protein